MKKNHILIALAGVMLLLAACGEKKKSKDIITRRVETKVSKEPVRMQAYDDERPVKWLGKPYQVAVHREACDSLPLIKNEVGERFVDNVFTLKVTRNDGSVFYHRTMTKAALKGYINDDFYQTGIFEGLVFDRVDGDWLVFAASVGHPHTDEYIPLVIRLSRMGELAISVDTQMDVNSADSSSSVDDEDEGV